MTIGRARTRRREALRGRREALRPHPLAHWLQPLPVNRIVTLEKLETHTTTTANACNALAATVAALQQLARNNAGGGVRGGAASAARSVVHGLERLDRLMREGRCVEEVLLGAIEASDGFEHDYPRTLRDKSDEHVAEAVGVDMIRALDVGLGERELHTAEAKTLK